MGNPSISVRKHYRLIPGDPNEPTSTLVLTSQKSHFIDVRILRNQDREGNPDELPNNGGPMSRLDWAFAGVSHTTIPHDDAKPMRTVWEHWIDSKTTNPGPDEGDMYIQPNGEVLERGTQTNKSTGQHEEYEELWGDLDVEVVGDEKQHVCLVLKAEDDSLGVKGMVIRIGGWCQGILKTEQDLTIERWKWVSATTSSSSRMDPGMDITFGEQQGDVSHWERVAKLGNGQLPCADILQEDVSRHSPSITCDGIRWDLVESHHW